MTRLALTYERLCRIVLMVFVVNVAMLVPLNRRGVCDLPDLAYR